MRLPKQRNQIAPDGRDTHDDENRNDPGRCRFHLDRLRQSGSSQVFGYPGHVANGMVPVFAGFGPRGLLGVLSAMLGRSRRAGRDAGISDW